MTSPESPRSSEVPNPHAAAVFDAVASLAGEGGNPVLTAVQEIRGEKLAALFVQGYLGRVEQDPTSPMHAAELHVGSLGDYAAINVFGVIAQEAGRTGTDLDQALAPWRAALDQISRPEE